MTCIIFFIYLVIATSVSSGKTLHSVGGIFDNDIDFMAFKLLVMELNNQNPKSAFELVDLPYKASYIDTFEARIGVCNHLENGVVGIFGPSSTYSSLYIQSICDHKAIPHIETHWDRKMDRSQFSVNLHPHPNHIAEFFMQLVHEYEWNRFIILYENDESFLRIAPLLEMTVLYETNLILRQLQLDKSDSYREILLNLKLIQEYRILIDCTIETLEKVFENAQEIGMLNENYQYIITNFDFTTLNLERYQYAGANITGKTLNGLTGNIEFDHQGFRKFKINIVELTPNGISSVGDWSRSTKQLSINSRYIPPEYDNMDEKKKLFNKHFKIKTCLTDPYAMLQKTAATLVGNDRYEGFCIDVISELAAILNFNYTFDIQEDGNNGKLNKDTMEWDGALGAVINGEADFAIADLTITAEREQAVDFTMPFMNLGISILYKKAKKEPPNLFMFTSPFTTTVWIMLGVAYILVSLAIFIMGRISPSEWTNPYPCVDEPDYLVNQFSIRNSLWFTIGALMQQGSELAPISISTRTASGFWWFFVLIMVASYTANLAAFLTVVTTASRFKNIEELVNQDKIKFGCKIGGATESFFKGAKTGINKQVGNYLTKYNNDYNLEKDKDGVAKVENENFAYLMESTSIEYTISRHCTLDQIGGLLDDKAYGIAMQRHSPYRNELSAAILKLQESGTLASLKIKWWKEKRGGSTCEGSSGGNSEAIALDLINVGGVFLVLFVGAGLGLIGSFLELCYKLYVKSKGKKELFKEYLKKELNFFLQFKQNTKETNDEKES